MPLPELLAPDYGLLPTRIRRGPKGDPRQKRLFCGFDFPSGANKRSQSLGKLLISDGRGKRRTSADNRKLSAVRLNPGSEFLANRASPRVQGVNIDGVELRTQPTRFWLVRLSVSAEPVCKWLYAVILPGGSIVEPTVREWLRRDFPRSGDGTEPDSSQRPSSRKEEYRSCARLIRRIWKSAPGLRRKENSAGQANTFQRRSGVTPFRRTSKSAIPLMLRSAAFLQVKPIAPIILIAPNGSSIM